MCGGGGGEGRDGSERGIDSGRLCTRFILGEGIVVMRVWEVMKSGDE